VATDLRYPADDLADTPTDQSEEPSIHTLLPAWHAFRDVRAARRAVDWLVGNPVVGPEQASVSLPSTLIPDLP